MARRNSDSVVYSLSNDLDHKRMLAETRAKTLQFMIDRLGKPVLREDIIRHIHGDIDDATMVKEKSRLKDTLDKLRVRERANFVFMSHNGSITTTKVSGVVKKPESKARYHRPAKEFVRASEAAVKTGRNHSHPFVPPQFASGCAPRYGR